MNEGIRNRLTTMARPMNLKRMISWTGQHVIFPLYHTVSPGPLPHVNPLYRVLDPLAFEKDLEQLLKWFEPVSLEAYLDGSEAGRGKRRMVLSFDDGLKGCHEFIAPMLRKKGVPALFFLNNRFIDNKGLFYRYRAALLIDRIRKDCRALERVATFLKIGKEQVEPSVRLINWNQRALLESLCREAEVDDAGYLRSRPVYMSSRDIGDLLNWGFEIGAHAADHADFTFLQGGEIIEQVRSSIRDLQEQFGVRTAYFSFPFTSDGVEGRIIESLLEQGIASALMGTAGLKRTGRPEFIQRIPMEKYQASALEALKSEYLYYLIKMPLGRNRIRS